MNRHTQQKLCAHSLLGSSLWQRAHCGVGEAKVGLCGVLHGNQGLLQGKRALEFSPKTILASLCPKVAKVRDSHSREISPLI